jgi:hypothetical protein
MAAYLGPEVIPRSFFSVLEGDSAAGRKRIADAMTALHSYSLATVTENHVSIHRLLQKVVRDRLTGREQADAILQAFTAIQRSTPKDPRLPVTWPQLHGLLPHIMALASNEAVAVLHADQLIDTIDPICSFLLAAVLPHEAVDLATRAFDVSMANYGPDNFRTLNAQANLATS